MSALLGNRNARVLFALSATLSFGVAAAGIDQSGVAGIDQSGVLGIDQSGELGIDQSGVLGIDQSGVLGIDQSGVLGIDQSGVLGIDQSGELGIDQSGVLGIDQSGVLGIDQSGVLGIDQSGVLGIDQSGELGIDQSGVLGIDQSGVLGIDQSGELAIAPVLAGPVDSIDLEQGTFTSLGQTVISSRSTLGRLQVGKYVFVEGTVVSSGWLYADRLHVSDRDYVPGSDKVLVTGLPSIIDGTTGTAEMGSLIIDYTASMSDGSLNTGTIWQFVGIRPSSNGVLISDKAHAE